MNSSGDAVLSFDSSKLKLFIDKLKKDKKALLILLIGIAGMLLILFSGTGSQKEKVTAVENTSYYSEAEILEKVTNLIESINGVGKAKLVITYESAYESIYAVNSEEKLNGNDSQIKKEYILTDDETGLILKVVYPKVRGVAVICQGGDDPAAKEKIYSVISALFDISYNKISVADMA